MKSQLTRNQSPRHTTLALHCSGSSGRQWMPYRSLLPSGAVLVSPDLLGYGSKAVWENPQSLELSREVEALEDVMCTLGDRFDLVGHSYGGAVAVAMALHHPERVRSLTVYEPALFHLLECEAGCEQSYRTIRQVAESVASLCALGRTAQAAEQFINYWFGSSDAWASTETSRRSAIASRMPKVAAEFEALFSARLDIERLASMPIPVRVVCGSRTTAVARQVAELLNALLPRAQFIRVGGADHMSPIKDSEKLARWIFHVAFGDAKAAPGLGLRTAFGR